MLYNYQLNVLAFYILVEQIMVKTEDNTVVSISKTI